MKKLEMDDISFTKALTSLASQQTEITKLTERVYLANNNIVRL